MSLQLSSPSNTHEPQRTRLRMASSIPPTCKQSHRNEDLDCAPTIQSPAQSSRIDDWLSQIPSPNSLLGGADTTTPRSLTSPPVLDSMENSPGPASTTSTTSTMSTMSTTSTTSFTSTWSTDRTPWGTRHNLDCNGIDINITSDDIPQAIMVVIEQHVTTPQFVTLSENDKTSTIKLVKDFAWCPVTYVDELKHTSLFPKTHPELWQGRRKRWTGAILPNSSACPEPIKNLPRPEWYYGYKRFFGPWPAKLRNAIQCNKRIKRLANQAHRCYFPFLAIECNSDVRVAENEAAKSGSSCVKAAKDLLDQAKSHDPVTNPIVFTIVAHLRYMMFYVHFYDTAKNRYHMSA